MQCTQHSANNTPGNAHTYLHTHTVSLSGSTHARCEETQSNVARNTTKNHEEWWRRKKIKIKMS